MTRIYFWHPELVLGLFSAGTPYIPPEPTWLDQAAYEKKFPTFAYQKMFGSKAFEEAVQGPEMIRLMFIATFYPEPGPNGEMPYSPIKGAMVENWPLLKKSDMMTDEVSVARLSRYTAAAPCCAWSHWPASRRFDVRSLLTVHASIRDDIAQ